MHVAGHSVQMPMAGMGPDLQEREVGQGEGGAADAAGHRFATLNAGMGADLQEWEAGQGEGGCGRQPGTRSQRGMLAWGPTCKSGRLGNGKGGCGGIQAQHGNANCWHGGRFARARWGKGKGGCSGRQPGTASHCQLLAWGQICKRGGGARGRGAADEAGHSVRMPLAGMGPDLQERGQGGGGQGEGGCGGSRGREVGEGVGGLRT